MPAPMIKSMAKEHGKSEKEVEKLYKKAKEIAAENNRKDDYAYISGILKNMLGENMEQFRTIKRNRYSLIIYEKKYTPDEVIKALSDEGKDVLATIKKNFWTVLDNKGEDFGDKKLDKVYLEFKKYGLVLNRKKRKQNKWDIYLSGLGATVRRKILGIGFDEE